MVAKSVASQPGRKGGRGGSKSPGEEVNKVFRVWKSRKLFLKTGSIISEREQQYFNCFPCSGVDCKTVAKTQQLHKDSRKESNTLRLQRK